MKYIKYLFIAPLAFGFIVTYPVFAQGQGGGNAGGSGGGTGGGQSSGSPSQTSNTGAGSGLGDQDQTRDQDRIQDPSTHTGDTTTPIMDQDRLRDQDRLSGAGTTSYSTTTPAGTLIQLRAMIQNQNQEGQNNNQAENAIQVMYAARNLAGNIGPQLANLANAVENSFQATTQAEEQIQTRGAFSHFFFGGDKNSATIIEQQLEQNKERIQEMNQVVDNCTSCGDQLRQTLKEQIQIMEQEQNRLNDVANKEKSSGLFGFLFGWLK